MYHSIRELSRLFASKELSPAEHVMEQFERIEKHNPDLKAFVYIARESALKAARDAEAKFMKGIVDSPIQGITIGLKDLIYTYDAPTTKGCQYYSEHPIAPGYDSAAAETLRKLGAVILGKTTTQALAMGSTGDSSWGGCAKNPFDKTKVTGGSSSGSAAAVAANLCDAALGHDTAGSVRIPAALCGLVGMKPTFGRISKYGLSHGCFSVDCIGPITNTVEDAAILLSALSGYDERDSYSLDVPGEDFTRAVGANVQNIRVGVPLEWIESEHLDEEARAGALRVVEVLRGMGIKITDVSASGLMPARSGLAGLRAAHQTIILCDFFYNHHDVLEYPDKVPKAIYERLLLGDRTALERAAAFARRDELLAVCHKLYDAVDVLLTPSTAIPACDIMQEETWLDGRPYSCAALYTEFTWIDSFTGYPSMSLPCGMTKNGLPLGVLLNAKRRNEKFLFSLGSALEKELAFEGGCRP